jgi:hypothetical protein
MFNDDIRCATKTNSISIRNDIIFRPNFIMQSNDDCNWQPDVVGLTSTSMMTIPENGILHNNLTTKVSNLTSSSATTTKSSLSVSFFDAHAVHSADEWIDGSSNNKNNDHNSSNNNESKDDDHEDSEYLVPHLMRASSQDEDDDISGSFDDIRSEHTRLPMTLPNRIPPSPVESIVEEGEPSIGT